MRIVVSPRVAKEYRTRIQRADPEARLIVPSLSGDAVSWSDDVGSAEVCCFSEDLWQDAELRRKVLPVVFQLQGLKWFHTFSAGTDAPAFQVLIDRGTILTNSSGASARSIAQYVLAMMLYRAKRLEVWRAQQASHEWRQLETEELTGKTVCVVGVGAIGGEVARLARAFGMHVVGIRRSARRARFTDEQYAPSQLLAAVARADYVVLACPLTPETTGLIGERELRAMKETATLINVARGAVVQEDALVRALQERSIAGACLDVFAREPLPETSSLWELDGVIVTPHNAGFSPLNMERAMAMFLDNLGRFVAGRQLRNRVRSAGGG